MSQPLVSIVIVAYNSGVLLVECLRNALASEVPVEVIVSDNGSDDGIAEVIDEMAAADPRLRLVRNARNLGFGAANNVTLPACCGDYVLFLNPDCLVSSGTIGAVVAELAARPDFGMAGCLIRNPDGSEEPSDRRAMPTPRRLMKQLLGAAEPLDGSLPSSPIAVEAISGAFMLVRRDLLGRVGGFDERYFMHWEDLDLCQRFHVAGIPILFVPGAEVIHHKGRSSRRTPLRVEWHKHASMARFLRKFHMGRWPLPAFALVQLAITARFALVALTRFHRDGHSPPTFAGTSDAATAGTVWVFGATSVVGRALLPRLVADGFRVHALSTDPAARFADDGPHLRWHVLAGRTWTTLPDIPDPALVVSLMPLDVLAAHVPGIADRGRPALIAFSSTSALTKARSADPDERALAARLVAAETTVQAACAQRGMRWVILRPTMIYLLGHDKNITRIAKVIRGLKAFPMPGEGSGLRQPVHAEDLARACIALWRTPAAWGTTYNLSGGETLTYRAMVERVFARCGLRPRILRPPTWLWRAALLAASLLPAYRDINVAMLKRTDSNLDFDHAAAAQGFGYSPRPFLP